MDADTAVFAFLFKFWATHQTILVIPAVGALTATGAVYFTAAETFIETAASSRPPIITLLRITFTSSRLIDCKHLFRIYAEMPYLL
jgi:hypothetical protein